MTPVEDKVEEMHVDFWGSYNPFLLLINSDALILLCEKTRKTWVLYLCSKDEFVDIFQIWLFKVKNKSNFLLKNFYADGKGEFIFIKLRIF